MVEILEIFNEEEDYAVVVWEESGLSVEDTAKLCRESEDGVYEDSDNGWCATIHKFNFTVSNEQEFASFLNTVKDMFLDYDYMKNHGFYFIESK
jgi:hypothetical protein